MKASVKGQILNTDLPKSHTLNFLFVKFFDLGYNLNRDIEMTLSCKEGLTMQAVKGYIENGRFYPTGKLSQSPGRIKAVLTILDEPAEAIAENNEDHKLRMDWLNRLSSAIKFSQDEEFPDITRSQFIKEPIKLTD